MAFAVGHLQQHPLPPGVVGALSLTGYQLLADVGGVGAGRLGQQAFLLVAAEPEASAAGEVTHISLHQTRLGSEDEAGAYRKLAAQLGYLRLAGYRVALERAGLHSKVDLVNPASGAIVLQVPAKHPGKLFGGGANVRALLAAAQALPPAGAPPDLQDPELLRQTLLALALRDDSTTGAQAAELADRALTLAQGGRTTADPVALLEAARKD
ncbi:MAG TPA: hypothetical protein VME01_05560 [Solirubrobacteraceae bacterium]|nr:hypothetical protein [Solirubrobacteraceae bacterium]